MNSADPRATGPPCFGEHLPAVPGGGSPSGANERPRDLSLDSMRLLPDPLELHTGLRKSWLEPSSGTVAGGHHGAVEFQEAVEARPGGAELQDKKINLDGAEKSLESIKDHIQPKADGSRLWAGS